MNRWIRASGQRWKRCPKVPSKEGRKEKESVLFIIPARGVSVWKKGCLDNDRGCAWCWDVWKDQAKWQGKGLECGHLPCDGAVLRLVLLWQSAQLWAPPGLMDTSTELIKMQVTAPFQARMRVLGTPRRRCLLSDFLRVSFQGPAQKTGMPGRRGSSAVGLNPKPWSNQPQQLCPYLLPL